MVIKTTHDTIMNEQQLIKTIEDQNQVIIAKDATNELLRKQLVDAKSELNELYLDRSWQKMQREYLTEAMWHSSIVADLCISETWITTMMKPVF